MSYVWAIHKQESLYSCHCSCSANSGAWRIMITIAPVHLHSKRGFPYLALSNWASMWKEGWMKAVFLPQLFPTLFFVKGIILWIECVLLKLVKKMVFCPAASVSLRHLCLIFVVEKKELHFFTSCMHCLNDSICISESWMSAWPFIVFHLFFSQFHFLLSMLLHLFR